MQIQEKSRFKLSFFKYLVTVPYLVSFEDCLLEIFAEMEFIIYTSKLSSWIRLIGIWNMSWETKKNFTLVLFHCKYSEQYDIDIGHYMKEHSAKLSVLLIALTDGCWGVRYQESFLPVSQKYVRDPFFVDI